ncbi:MAG: DUF1990 domain-containing protein [Acidobacteriota bacterium]|nr:DUF1990 domain-containing protein [Acidobacteriota bacterium]
MFLFDKPSEKEISDFIAAQSRVPFSYREVGVTINQASPVGYPINRYRKELGKGQQTYKNAVKALCSWQMYALDWTRLYPSNAPIKEGEVVATLVKHLGFWSINPCRIIYLIDEESEKLNRYGFAFGTLPAHSEQGEEQFLVEWDKEGDTVWYELYAFAKPQNWLAKIGFPFVSFLQKHFAAQSYRAMLKAVIQKQ